MKIFHIFAYVVHIFLKIDNPIPPKNKTKNKKNTHCQLHSKINKENLSFCIFNFFSNSIAQLLSFFFLSSN